MLGRDPREAHRSVTPLELLFDLTFVVAFSQAGDQLAHYVAEAHIATAVWGFAFVLLSVCWAWINFTWFASAFDTDDWLQRVLTMVQMVGVIVLALGIPAVFESIDSGEPFDFVVVAVGYVIMRVSLVLMWLRVARQDPANRRVALRYACVVPRGLRSPPYVSRHSCCATRLNSYFARTSSITKPLAGKAGMRARSTSRSCSGTV